VGRGAARAYAYFFRHNKLRPTPEGQERLEVIAENTQLGSGYSIAMRDLEMRGAGELLGTRQSGHIASVGFHLYTRLLAAAVRLQRLAGIAASQTGRSSLFEEVGMPVNVDLPLAIGIPAEYVPDTNLRLRLYRRLADLTDESALEAIAAEFEDRFGKLPEMVTNLLYQMKVKMRAEKAGLSSVGMENGQIVLRFPVVDETVPANRVASPATGVRLGKNAYWCTFGGDPDWQERLLETLKLIKAPV
jgi:transcription-repair coupling factor (superfamily II helicase)